MTSCKNEKERAIVGKWNAAKLVECDNVVPMNNTAVNLEFMSNGNYVFNSTLNVHEEGEFYIKKNHLYTKDKLREKAVEKIVKIQELAGDTLVLEMNYKGKEQWLTLVRDKNAKSSAAPIAKTTEPQPNPTTANNNVIAVSSPTGDAKPIAAPVAPVEAPKPEVKPEPKKDEDISAAEAYRRREALRQKEEAERIQLEKEKREGYLKREAQRQKEELERKRAALEREKEHDREVREAYLKREAKRKEEERQRKAKKS